MIFLLFGKQNYLIDKKIKEILEENGIDSLNISNYDLEINDINKIIEDASTISLFSNKKTLIIDNSIIFNSNKKNKDIDTKELEDYLNNINKDTILIFIVREENINKTKKIVKLVDKIGKIFEFNETINIEKYISQELKNYDISHGTLKLFHDRVGNNIEIINQEIEKIKIYKNNDKEITENDILNLVNKNYELNIFSLIDKIITKKLKEALGEYYEMLKYNEEPIKIISILADNFRLMYQIKELVKKGYSNYDIASDLKCNPYRVKIIMEKSKYYSSKQLLDLLYELANLDIDIKQGKIDKKIGLELFIIKNSEVN